MCLLALLDSKEDPTAAPRCLPIRSQILRQQLVNQPLKLLLGKDSEMVIFGCSLYAEACGDSHGKSSCTTDNSIFLFAIVLSDL